MDIHNMWDGNYDAYYGADPNLDAQQLRYVPIQPQPILGSNGVSLQMTAVRLPQEQVMHMGRCNANKTQQENHGFVQQPAAPAANPGTGAFNTQTPGGFAHPYPHPQLQQQQQQQQQASTVGQEPLEHFLAPDTIAPVPPRLEDEPGRHKTGFTVPDPTSVEELGRSYHGYRYGKYLLPNDGSEQDRLDMQHTQWMLLMAYSLAWAPIGRPRRVLDIGTGTGIWALEFAQQNPYSEVIGTDVSAIQATRDLPNVTFVQEDTEEAWTLGGSFDYIHLRMMFTCFLSHRDVIRNVFENLTPGGWAEYQDASLDVQDVDESLQTMGKAIRRWAFLAVAGAAALGRNWDCAKRYKDWMIEAGFVDVVERKLNVPGNPWPADPKEKEIGRFQMENSSTGIEGVSLKCIRQGLGMPIEYVRQVVSEATTACRDEENRHYWSFYVVYGRKPHDWERKPPAQSMPPSPPLPSSLVAEPKREQNLER